MRADFEEFDAEYPALTTPFTRADHRASIRLEPLPEPTLRTSVIGRGRENSGFTAADFTSKDRKCVEFAVRSHSMAAVPVVASQQCLTRCGHEAPTR
jgi:hypothetical protein